MSNFGFSTSPSDIQRPFVERDVGLNAEVENGPILYFVLAGRETQL